MGDSKKHNFHSLIACHKRRGEFFRDSQIEHEIEIKIYYNINEIIRRRAREVALKGLDCFISQTRKVNKVIYIHIRLKRKKISTACDLGIKTNFPFWKLNVKLRRTKLWLSCIEPLTSSV